MTVAPGREQGTVRWRRRTVILLLVVAGLFVVRAVADMWLEGR